MGILTDQSLVLRHFVDLFIRGNNGFEFRVAAHRLSPIGRSSEFFLSERSFLRLLVFFRLNSEGRTLSGGSVHSMMPFFGTETKVARGLDSGMEAAVPVYGSEREDSMAVGIGRGLRFIRRAGEIPISPEGCS